MKLNKKGFTLMELIIVVILIALMAAMSYPSYLNTVEKSRATEAINIVGLLMAAQAKYFEEMEKYASDIKELDFFPANTDNGKWKVSYENGKLKTSDFEYSANSNTITATPKSGDYSIRGDVNEDTMKCHYSNESGSKICSALGKCSGAGVCTI
jgi:type IV pilus assembly protein PilE